MDNAYNTIKPCFWTSKNICDYLNVSRQRLSQLRKTHDDFPRPIPLKINKKLMFCKADVLKWVSTYVRYSRKNIKNT